MGGMLGSCATPDGSRTRKSEHHRALATVLAENGQAAAAMAAAERAIDLAPHAPKR